MKHKLTKRAISAEPTPEGKPKKLSDGGGLFLLLNPKSKTQPNGSRWWRFRYRIKSDGKMVERLISVGVYPEVTLEQARDKAEQFRKTLEGGGDPSIRRQVEKGQDGNTFKAVAEEFLTMQAKSHAPGTIRQKRDRLERYIYPKLGSRPIGDLRAPDFLMVLRRIESQDLLETAHRTKGVCGEVMRYAVATGRAERDPTGDLRGAIASRAAKHHAGITDPKRLGELLRAIDGYEGYPWVMLALRLAPLLFVRPGELRKAEWREFDLDSEEPTWRIPAERMKMRDAHVVPLSRQAVAILRELAELRRGDYVFPGARSKERPISDNTVNAALRRLGYTNDEATGHGFRTTASTLLNEQGFDPDAIELQLAHKPRDKVRAAYNRAQKLAERRTMMQAWADYLDGLKAGGEVVAIGSRKGAA